MMNINMLFVVGGDGSMRGALEIARVIEERGDKIAVVGVPKTIDNDIPFIDRSFASRPPSRRRRSRSARPTWRPCRPRTAVGMVKVMGRHSGFIACYSALAKGDADFVLIPEVPFALDGEDGVLAAIRKRGLRQGACGRGRREGAGQEHLPDQKKTDASGNARLNDIAACSASACRRLRRARNGHQPQVPGPELLDPQRPCEPYDSVYCLRLAHAAVHAAMSGGRRWSSAAGTADSCTSRCGWPSAAQHGRPQR